MKTKKLFLLLMLMAALAAGWFLSIRSVTGTEVIREQNRLVAEADDFLSRSLYVRAISLYEQALQEPSVLTDTIQEKLLGAYEAYGDRTSYLSLVGKRMAAGSATEEEYLTAAKYYVEKADLESAAKILKEGMSRMDSRALQEYYEQQRYDYRIRTTRYAVIRPSASNQLMPAYNGEKWGYVDENGREALPFIYEEAVAFNEQGYGAVLFEGTYYTILANGDRYGADDGSSYSRMSDVRMVSGSRILGQRDGAYSYFNYDFEPLAATHQYSDITGNACGVAAVQKDGRWGIITDSGERVLDFILEEVAVNSLGCAFAGDRAMVKENGRWHLIDAEGKPVGSNTYDDAKAPESDGYIAVADASGKWGFIDRNGEMVISCQYNDAYSFSQHLGAVQTVNDWVYISEQNKTVIEKPFQSALPFHNGIAQASLSEGMALITLQYIEE